jgi:predicted acyltransferase
LSGFGKVARASLAAMTAGVLILILVGLLLVWFGLAGYKDWSVSQRTIAGGLGLADAIGFGFLLAALLRQQIVGLPRVGATTAGLAVGSALIPWAEIEDIGAASLFGLPHVGIVQASTAPRRLRGLRSLQYMPQGDRRILFLAARQLGTSFEGDAQRIREVWVRARSIAADS